MVGGGDLGIRSCRGERERDVLSGLLVSCAAQVAAARACRTRARFDRETVLKESRLNKLLLTSSGLVRWHVCSLH